MKPMKLWDSRLGLIKQKGRPVVCSRFVAKIFGKEHKNILRDITKITEANSGLSEEFRQLNFEPSSYRNEQNKKQPEYLLTRDGFTLLVMGFSGKKAMRFKETYIRRFNDMERYLKALDTARIEFPELTQVILEVHEKPRHYHFSNEMDMINRIVLGKSAREFKKTHNLGDVRSIRPYLTAEQIEHIGQLQKADIGLVLTEPDFQKRKRTLEWYFIKLKQKRLAA